ncbi:MAG TPA: rhodanese-like domain-containing protein [Gemmataceae bacterium]|jgi:rhodanese-related sulfurtransferase|nr:rhodanese-like domain-containing protein [Gemmataceae bacterium]
MAKQHAPGFLKLVQDAKSRVKECTVADVKQRLDAGDKFVLVDVREESEWAAGHAAGAVHLSKGVIERDVETKIPDKATPLVLYCGGGFRSALVADNLQKMGYTNVISMDGGWRGWTQAGMPVVR